MTKKSMKKSGTIIREEDAQKAVTSLDITTRILDAINAMIYVTDPETGEILYINETMKQHYNIKGGVGDICYRVLQDGTNERCVFCPCHTLDKEPDKTVVWEEHSSLTNRFYTNTDRYLDWTDGRKVHIQHSVDITDLKLKQEELEHHQKMTDAIYKTATTFLSRSEDSFDDMMTNGIKIIADIVDIDRMSIWRNIEKPDGLYLSQMYRWEKSAGGTTPPRPIFADITYTDYVPTWAEKFANGEVINSPTCLMHEKEAATMKAYGIVSAFAAPVYIDNKYWGFVLFEDHRNERYFDEDSVEMLRSGAILCVNAFIREELEHSISEAEKRSKLMLDSSPLCCQIWDWDMNVIDCNEACVRLYGLTDKKEYIERFFELSPEYQPDGLPSLEKAISCLNKAFDKGSCVFEWMHQMPDGTPVPAEITLVRVKHKNDYVVIGYTQDLRNHKKMMREIEQRDQLLNVINRVAVDLLSAENEDYYEESMRKSMELIGSCLDADFVQIWEHEKQENTSLYRRRHSWVSEAGHRSPYAVIEKAAPYPAYNNILILRDKCIKAPFFQIPQDKRDLKNPHKIKSTITIPLFFQEKFWGVFSVSDCIRNRSYSNDEMGILRSAGLMLVSAINRYQQAIQIRKAEELTKLMMDATPFCCELWTHEGRIIDCNEETLRFFNMGNKQKLLDEIYTFSPELQPDGLRSVELFYYNINKALNEGKFTLEWQHVFTDGTLVPVELTLVPVEYKGSRIVAIYKRDLREAKAAEQQMLESMEKQQDLEIQRQTAQAANDAKTQFLANMSHEIRTPMNAIIGMSDLLLSEDLNIRQHRYAEDIKISSNALLNIINDILDISKIQAAKLSLIPVHFNFNAFIDYLNSMTRFLIQDKMFSVTDRTLTYEADVDDDIPECLYGDDVRLRQILLNVLSNAVKYTKEGHITMTIRTEGETLFVTVTDTGMGIPAESLPTLFGAFEQADLTINRGTQGTGLGLTITKSLVELMGGSITAESEYGKGSSFHIVLPMVTGDVSLIKIEDDTSAIVYVTDANVLVVDDRETNLNVVCGLLHQCHIIADKALSGADAIEMVTKKQYDLIFMDHMMPEMDGVEATKILREMGVNIPIVALTANAVTGARELLLSAGMDDFISKPIDKIKLYNILRSWIPPHKITDKPPPKASDKKKEDLGPREKLFKSMIKKIKGLSVETGLELASGELKPYIKTLEVSVRESEKSMENLNTFLNDNDMENFRIEVHGMKGSLSLIGARALSAEALALENASRDGDTAFCIANLPGFLNALDIFVHQLKNAFEVMRNHEEPLDIPPELPPIFERLMVAMDNIDFDVLYGEHDKLDEIQLTGTVKDEVESLKTAVMIMDYDNAREIIKRLTK